MKRIKNIPRYHRQMYERTSGSVFDGGVLFFIMNSRKRRALEKTYSHLYRRVSGFNWGVCIYCGGEAVVFDHCPPLTKVEYLNINEYVKKGGKFRLYPSCHMCNTYLGSFSDTNFYNRLEYLLKKYDKKLDTIEPWSERELSEMGHAMKAHIKNKQSSFDIINTKLTGVAENLASNEYAHLE